VADESRPLLAHDPSLPEAPAQSNSPSIATTSSLPRLPSMCLLSHDRYSAKAAAQEGALPSLVGLGLSALDHNHGGSHPVPVERAQSVASTVPDDFVYDPPPSALQGEGPAFDAVLDFNRSLHLDVSGDTIPNTFNMETIVQSATEVATPSIANTPDLAAVDQAVNNGKQALEALLHLASSMDHQRATDAAPGSVKSAPSPQRLLPNSPRLSQDQLHKALKSASPPSLQQLTSYLPSLYNLLSAIPNVANTMRELSDRLSMLESNNSFNYVHPDEVQERYDNVDGRLLHLESRMDDHDTMHQAIDADSGSHVPSRRLVATVTDSFNSTHSLQSTTSSALILAAVDRNETETEINAIKDRLDILEAFAMPPTLSAPWEIEVILLPWGRELRGIWYSPDDTMQDASDPTSQDSEEWTQARSLALGKSRTSLGPYRDGASSPFSGAKHSSRSSHPFSDTESGWSSQAISDWASGLTEELLSPKACKSANLVYKRLRSRGLVKDVTFRSSSARDIQAMLSRTFKEWIEYLRYTDEDENPTVTSFPGLRASFIPLRKVRHDSRLRFLTPAEMSSSALWSAQFLHSDIMMHVTGGKKRLYVTHREAYIQATDHMGTSWTWQELRQLPRIQPQPEAPAEGGDGEGVPQVAEADAKEACWTFFEAYDAPPPSVTSSFGSHHSLGLSMRPAVHTARRSVTPASILRNPALQPISPLSEIPHRRPRQGRERTVSASILEPVAAPSSKRRLNSSPVKQSSLPHHARGPSASMTRSKRRRFSRSQSPRPAALEAPEAQVTIWGHTPRRSREPQSPFFSSVAPPLPRTNSDLASRPSQRSVAVMSKGTPFAYATPHSGPFNGGVGFGAGDTEADEDLYQDDDGEQSWRGVTSGDEGSDSEDYTDSIAQDEHPSFSEHNEYASGSEEDADSEARDGEDGAAAAAGRARHTNAEEEDDDDDDPLDKLLDVLEH